MMTSLPSSLLPSSMTLVADAERGVPIGVARDCCPSGMVAGLVGTKHDSTLLQGILLHRTKILQPADKPLFYHN
jgi:hypothetical protein